MKNNRFEFGKNWKKYSKTITNEKIQSAEKSLVEWLEEMRGGGLSGKSFLDIGSGSGLFSLAAKRLGAKVYSFDYDEDSVACTKMLKNIYDNENDKSWVIERGDILDQEYVKNLMNEGFDIVYSWGVLHHTGKMNEALDNAEKCLKREKGSKLFIAIYNDQGSKSIQWRKLKKLYNSVPINCRWLLVLPSFIYVYIANPIFNFICHPVKALTGSKVKKQRGMNKYEDMIDWLGGYPFEVAKPEEIIDRFIKKGYRLVKLSTVGGGLGCNQYVFEKE